MSYFSVNQLSVSLGGFALRNLSFSLEQGQTLVILGPTGSGKSVLLETVAGFNTPATGRIELEGKDIGALPPEKRGLGYVFQNYALFPHLTVEKNIGYGLRSHPDAGRRITEMLDFLGIRHLARRKPDTLSGGEKQRVALARALATNPRLFLFDEPLSAVDAATRDTLRDELRDFLKDLDTPSLYVTHDRTEALVLADMVAVIRDGTMQQMGTTDELFTNPANSWVARFMGMQVVRPERVKLLDGNRAEIAIGGTTLKARRRATAGQNWAVAFQPEDVRLTRPGTPDEHESGTIPATVAKVLPLGPLIRFDLEGPVSITALLFRRDYAQLDLSEGDSVHAFIDEADLQLVPEAENEE